jgi:hypothetical protein
MAGLPRKYARMGFKRGWAAYNRSKKGSRSKIRGVSKMARRKRYSKKRSYHRSGGFSMGGVTKILIGAGIAALYEVYVSPMIPIGGFIKNVAELTFGLLLMAMPRLPMPVKAFGTALAIINAYSLIVSYLPSGGSVASGDNW